MKKSTVAIVIFACLLLFPTAYLAYAGPLAPAPLHWDGDGSTDDQDGGTGGGDGSGDGGQGGGGDDGGFEALRLPAGALLMANTDTGSGGDTSGPGSDDGGGGAGGGDDSGGSDE